MSVRPEGRACGSSPATGAVRALAHEQGSEAEPIPSKLRKAAVKLCRTHGVSRVSMWLRLHHTKLKKRLGRRTAPHSVRPQPRFVEWRLPAGGLPGSSAAEYVVEVPSEGDGAQRVHVRGASVAEVAALARPVAWTDHMIQLTPHLRILVAVEPADFRQGIDGLSRVCRQRLEADPMSGAVFVFRNRRGRALKILVYDGQGFWLCQKRLSAGRFRFWPTPERGGRMRRLESHELQVLLACGDPSAAKAPPPWRRVGEAGSTTTVMSPAFARGQLRP